MENIKLRQYKREPKKVKEFDEIEWWKENEKRYGKGTKWRKESFKIAAYDGKKNILGTINLKIDTNVAYVKSLIVGEAYINMGVGTILLRRSEEIAFERGCNKIWLETSTKWKAKEFYLRQGYKQTGILEKHHFHYDFIIFTKFFK